MVEEAVADSGWIWTFPKLPQSIGNSITGEGVLGSSDWMLALSYLQWTFSYVYLSWGNWPEENAIISHTIARTNAIQWLFGPEPTSARAPSRLRRVSKPRCRMANLHISILGCFCHPLSSHINSNRMLEGRLYDSNLDPLCVRQLKRTSFHPSCEEAAVTKAKGVGYEEEVGTL